MAEDKILNVSDHGAFGGMTNNEIEQLSKELMHQPDYTRKKLAVLLIHSVLNITDKYLDDLSAMLKVNQIYLAEILDHYPE
tara:strand:+ start:177 stop:419 length:243 start_codon:yes stop_codon:yes gene_type:complete